MVNRDGAESSKLRYVSFVTFAQTHESTAMIYPKNQHVRGHNVPSEDNSAHNDAWTNRMSVKAIMKSSNLTALMHRSQAEVR